MRVQVSESWSAGAAMMAATLIVALASIGFLAGASGLGGSVVGQLVQIQASQDDTYDPLAYLTALIGGSARKAPAPAPAEDAADEEDEAPEANEPEVRVVTVEPGDRFSEILEDAGVDPAEAHAAIAALKDVFDPAAIRIGQKITLTLGAQAKAAPSYYAASAGAMVPQAAPPAASEQTRAYLPLLAIALKPSVERDVAVLRDPSGAFKADQVIKELIERDDRAVGTIEGSLYMSAKAQGVPDAVIVDLIKIFSYDVDFQREIQRGDQFEILFSHYYDKAGTPIKGGDIQYAALTLSGQKKELYRFTTEGDQATDYFNTKGSSGKTMLMKTPIDGARITSGFGRRKHPILGYTRVHRGVDFGAPTGTPIMAAGNAVVEFVGLHGGHGKYIRLRHPGTPYKTAYGHMSRYARGIKVGQKVRQGQVIGYVGSTGMSTGPHLHYEVMVKNEQINPLGVKLPTGRNLAGADMTRFKAQMAHVNELLRTLPAMPALVAQTGAGEPAQP